MANVINRTTKQFVSSANTPDYPVLDWIIDPDMTAVSGYQSKYWLITGDVVSLMSQAEMDTVDAVELGSSRDSIIAEIDKLEGILRAFAQVMRDEINILRGQHGLTDRTLVQLRTAMRNKVGS